MSWVRRLLGREREPAEERTLEMAAAAAQERREILEALQKLTRMQGKLALRLDEIDSKIEGGFTDVGAKLDEAQPPPSAEEVDWSELCDAVDLLAEATRHAGAQPELAAGLEGVRVRLDRFLAQLGIERCAPAGEAPDGRLFRVVGAETSPALPDGVVARVVRAAVLRGDELLREGEVIVTRRSAST